MRWWQSGNRKRRFFEDALRRPGMQRAFLLRCGRHGNVTVGGERGTDVHVSGAGA